MNIFILIFGILLLLIFSYISNQRNLLAPSLVCCASFLVGTSLLANNAVNQGFDIHLNTVIIILVGLLSVILGERVAIKGRKYIKTKNQVESYKNISRIIVNRKTSYVLLVVNIIIVYLFYKEIVRIGALAATSDITSFADIMAAYRVSMMFGDTLEYNINPMVSQAAKVPIITAYLYLYVFIFNVIKGVKLKKNILYLLVAIPYFFYTYYSGGRIGFIKILAAIMWFTFIVMYFDKDSIGFRKFESKFKKGVIIALATILGLFYSVRLAMGRSSSEDAEFLDYITMYVGTPTRLLDMYLEEPHYNDEKFELDNSETFSGISVVIAKLNGKKINNGLEFRFQPDGENLGNVYTPFRRYYRDFGFLGVIILPFIMGLILSKIQSECYFAKFYNKRCSFFILLFSYLYTALPTYAAEDIFYLRINVGFVEELFLLYLSHKFLVRYAIKSKRIKA